MSDQGRDLGTSRRRLAAGAGLSLGAALGMGATAEAAAFQVTTLADSGTGSLRQAILSANATGAADTVTFNSTLSGQIKLAGQLSVTGPVTVDGPGPKRVSVTTTGTNGIFVIDPAVAYSPVTIDGLTLTGSNSSNDGAAILNADADLTVTDALITNNKSLSGADDGAGIDDSVGNLTVRNTTISGNSASDEGAGIHLYNPHGVAPGAVLIENTTITGNHSLAGTGGGFFTYSTDPLTVRNSTISGNSATEGGGFEALYTDPVLTNTIVADNTAPSAPDIYNAPAQSTTTAMFSLIENTSGAIINGTPNVTGADPKLAPLADNGGSTPTQALGTGSPAFDKGLASGADQRGAPRPFDLGGIMRAPGGNSADIGAYERVLCAKVVVNRVGTAGKDKIKGTKGADGILGLGGKDDLAGLAGKDGLCGGPGKDILRGGGGNDKLLGQGGNDKLLGGKGVDKLTGGPGRDKQAQ